jgi:hypothetical protein
MTDKETHDMVIESGISQQASQFSESMNIRSAPAVEKTTEEIGQASKAPSQHGDTVVISQEARALAAAAKPDESDKGKQDGTALKGGSSSDDSQSTQEQLISRLEKQVEKLEKEIKELEDSDLPEKQKRQQVQAKQDQLMQLNDQLVKAKQEQLKLDGQASGGGTRAEGFGNSVSTF